MARTALVLGGGGITGIAWELGILQGLARAGVDLTGADTVIGTSAGSVVGAQITSGQPLDAVFETQLAPADEEIGARIARTTMARLVPPMLFPGPIDRKLRRIGRMAMRAHPPGGEERIEVIRSRLGLTEWPERDLRITAVEAETGEFRHFDRGSGVDLVHAVAASCAVPLVWPAVTIDGRHYLDGGMRLRFSPLELLGRVAFLPGIVHAVRLAYREPVLPTGHVSLLSERELRRELARAGLRVREAAKTGLYLPLIAEAGGERGRAALQRLARHGRLMWTQLYQCDAA